MIPQLKELSDYGVNGAWIDGECWAVEPDYGKESLKRFREETGIMKFQNPPQTNTILISGIYPRPFP